MITGVGLVCVYVLDMDEARTFYVDTLGLEVGVDMVQDGFRFLTVHSPAQPDVPIMLVDPSKSPMDHDLAEQIRSLVATGYLGPGALATDDCWATYPRAQGQGRGVHRGAGGALLRHRRRVPRSLRQPLAIDATEADRTACRVVTLT